MIPMRHAPALLLLAMVGPPAAAQDGPRPTALRGLDTGAPIDVDAARVEIFDADNQAVFSGAVVIRQGRLTLNADRVRVLYSRPAGGGDPKIQRLDARGSVKLVSPSETATGNTGLYDVDNRLITLAGNVRLNRNGSVLNGQRVVFNLDNGQTSFDGRTGGTGARPGAGQGRVTGRFVVTERGDKR